MRQFLDIMALLERAESTTLLYRGDVNKIDKFDIDKTDRDALFGSGMYLTSDPAVARDYSFARTYHVEPYHSYNGPFESQKELIADFLQHIIRDELDWDAERLAITDPFRDRVWQLPRDENRDQAVADIKDEAGKAVSAAYRKKLERAKAIYRERIGDYRVVKSTQGTWKLLKKEWGGVVSAYAVPDAYLNRCLNGDEPLPDVALKAIRDIIYKIAPSGMVDFRNGENERISFDDWVDEYRRQGVRYAWRGDTVGGDGKNPSMDDIFNGTHSGMTIRKADTPGLIAALRRAGFVGIEYYGGARVGGHIRGGGGVEHRAFVFWDVEYLSSVIVSVDPTNADEVDGSVLGRLRAPTMAKSYRGKR